MKLKQKLLAAAAVLTALSLSTAAQAGSAAGTVTITGTAVVSCTLTSPTVDFGATVPVARGQQTKQFTVDIDCPTGTTWSLGSLATLTNITIGGAAGNSALVQNAAGTGAIAGVSQIAGTGTGVPQSQTLTMRLLGNATGLVGTGAIVGSVPITLTY